MSEFTFCRSCNTFHKNASTTRAHGKSRSVSLKAADPAYTWCRDCGVYHHQSEQCDTLKAKLSDQTKRAKKLAADKAAADASYDCQLTDQPAAPAPAAPRIARESIKMSENQFSLVESVGEQMDRAVRALMADNPKLTREDAIGKVYAMKEAARLMQTKHRTVRAADFKTGLTPSPGGGLEYRGTNPLPKLAHPDAVHGNKESLSVLPLAEIQARLERENKLDGEWRPGWNPFRVREEAFAEHTKQLAAAGLLGPIYSKTAGTF